MGEEYVILIPQICISMVSWGQYIFSINRYRGVMNLTTSDLVSFIVLMNSALVRWVATLAVRSENVVFQMVSAFLGSTLGWTSFILVYNEDFLVPTKQQMVALLLSLTITMLWEINSRLVYEL
jgi:hypothetical protein